VTALEIGCAIATRNRPALSINAEPCCQAALNWRQRQEQMSLRLNEIYATESNR
jgi:hypothetical protein